MRLVLLMLRVLGFDNGTVGVTDGGVSVIDRVEGLM